MAPKKKKRSSSGGTTLASLESLSLPLVQEIVMWADIRCSECQKRVSEMMSRMSDTESVVVNVLEKKPYYCMVMRVTIDCNACFKKLRRSIRNIKGIDTHAIDKDLWMVSVCGTFRPPDVAIKLRNKMNRRVEILDVQQHQQPLPSD